MPATVRPAVTNSVPPRTVRATPTRLITTPADGSASTDPALIAISTSPSRDGVRSRESLTSGIREAQLAKVTPAITKAAITARWALRTCGVGSRRGRSADRPCCDGPCWEGPCAGRTSAPPSRAATAAPVRCAAASAARPRRSRRRATATSDRLCRIDSLVCSHAPVRSSHAQAGRRPRRGVAVDRVGRVQRHPAGHRRHPRQGAGRGHPARLVRPEPAGQLAAPRPHRRRGRGAVRAAALRLPRPVLGRRARRPRRRARRLGVLDAPAPTSPGRRHRARARRGHGRPDVRRGPRRRGDRRLRPGRRPGRHPPARARRPDGRPRRCAGRAAGPRARRRPHRHRRAGPAPARPRATSGSR